MNGWFTRLTLAGLVLGLAGVAALAATPKPAATQAMERTLYIAAIEPKGSTMVAQEPFPSAELPKGGGYLLKAPDADGRWEVSTYQFSPASFVVNQGDDVTLELVGINGKEHPTIIDGYDVAFNVMRGQVTRASFKADKAGVFNVICQIHRPAMTAQLVVLPRP